MELSQWKKLFEEVLATVSASGRVTYLILDSVESGSPWNRDCGPFPLLIWIIGLVNWVNGTTGSGILFKLLASFRRPDVPNEAMFAQIEGIIMDPLGESPLNREDIATAVRSIILTDIENFRLKQFRSKPYSPSFIENTVDTITNLAGSEYPGA